MTGLHRIPIIWISQSEYGKSSECPCFSISLYFGVIWSYADTKKLPHLEWSRQSYITLILIEIKIFKWAEKSLKRVFDLRAIPTMILVRTVPLNSKFNPQMYIFSSDMEPIEVDKTHRTDEVFFCFILNFLSTWKRHQSYDSPALDKLFIDC